MVVAAVVIIIVYFLPKYGQTHIIAYVGVCSLVGSIGVGNLSLEKFYFSFHTSVLSSISFLISVNNSLFDII